VVFINQLRMKIGVMFGNPETTTGGRALGFYASLRLDIRRVAQIKDGDEAVGSRTRVKVVKNKMAPPYRQAEFDLFFQGDQIGMSREGDIVDIGVDCGLIKKSGTWFSYNGERLGQGRENAKGFLADNEELAAALESRLRTELGLGNGSPPNAESGE
jgi:recombination protein RecA